MLETGVRRERTGWRDEGISARHRLWGFDCPAVDLDFLVVEYNHGLPVGLIEYKHERASTPSLKHPTYNALRALADGHHRREDGQFVHDPLPFLWVRYWPDIWAMKTHPANDIAAKVFNEGEILTERDFVARLYYLRRLTLNKHLAGALNTSLPSNNQRGAT